MASQILTTPFLAFQSGVFSPGAKLTFFESGTTTPITVVDKDDVAHPSPLVADAAGVIPAVFYDGAAQVKVVITAADNTTITTVDPAAKLSSSNSEAANLTFEPVNGNAATNVQDAIANNTSRHQDRSDVIKSFLSATSAAEAQTALGTEGDFTPESYGATGDGTTNDTAAFNKMLNAVAAATANGPVAVRARGSYLLDQLQQVSQYAASGDMPIQQNSIKFDFEGAEFIHSGTGDGILSFEGNLATRYKTNLLGGDFTPHTDTKWLIRLRDLRSSFITPELMGSPNSGYNCIGIFSQIWRSWSENMTYGAEGRNLEGRKITHIIRASGRAQSWVAEAYFANPSYFVVGTNDLSPAPADVNDPNYHTGAVPATSDPDADIAVADAAAVAAKGSAAATGDYYRAMVPGYKGWRIYRGSDWVWARSLLGVKFGWLDVGSGATDPSSGVKGDTFYNETTGFVRVYDGTAFQNVHEVSEVATSVAGRSYARTKIYDILMATAFDEDEDGQAVYIDNASAYGSVIDGIRGVANNEGGSLIYWDDAFAPNTVIRNIDIEKANDASDRKAVAIRRGPNTATNLRPPELHNIYYSTTRGMKVDPDAGFIWSGEELESNNFISTTAGVATKVFGAGLHSANTSYWVTLKANGNDPRGQAYVSRVNSDTGTLTIDTIFSTDMTFSQNNGDLQVTTSGAESLRMFVTVQKT